MWGWVLAKQGQTEEGIKHLAHGAAGWRSQGSDLWRPYWLALLVEAYTVAGRTAEAMAALSEAMNIAERTGETFYLAELYRLKGEIVQHLFQPSKEESSACSVSHPQLSTSAVSADAEGCFRRAIEVARHQQAKSLELRATTSLARLLAKQGRRDEARRMLAEIYNWFTEGFDTADLKDAKARLDQLSG
jgi:predicted ATPase